MNVFDKYLEIHELRKRLVEKRVGFQKMHKVPYRSKWLSLSNTMFGHNDKNEKNTLNNLIRAGVGV